MSVLRRRLVRFGAAVVFGGLALAAAWSRSDSVAAQVDAGEYTLIQGGTVGWVYVSPDGATEWWAYVQDSYDWADRSNSGNNLWHLGAQYMGSTQYSCFQVWKAAVLQRAEAQGETLVFQQHAVQEEVVQN